MLRCSNQVDEVDEVPEVKPTPNRRPTLARRMTIEEEHMGVYFVFGHRIHKLLPISHHPNHLQIVISMSFNSILLILCPKHAGEVSEHIPK
ncbi:hypothetical protein Q1695_009291 [Nippostrongylus brasiliensis]|nr:hypothetical protein Q1695_009291 [Nippostrongylus brasiliensis]